MPTTTVIADVIVMKLPSEVPWPAAPAVADAAPVNDPPAAIEPSETSLFASTGDSSPVIFLPVALRVAEPPPLHFEGEQPIAPLALAAEAECALDNFQRNRTISLIFCRAQRGVGCVNPYEYGRGHQEGCLLNTGAFGPRRPRFAGAICGDPQESRSEFHLQED